MFASPILAKSLNNKVYANPISFSDKSNISGLSKNELF